MTNKLKKTILFMVICLMFLANYSVIDAKMETPAPVINEPDYVTTNPGIEQSKEIETEIENEKVVHARRSNSKSVVKKIGKDNSRAY